MARDHVDNYNNIIQASNNWTILDWQKQNSDPKIKHVSTTNADTLLNRLHSAKHQIYEKALHPHTITSILYLKVRKSFKLIEKKS